MKRFRFTAARSLMLAAFLLASAAPLRAAPRDFAIGVSLGSPLGLTVLQNLGETEAVQAAFEAGVHNTWTLQGDYLMKTRWPQPIDEAYGKLWIYYGPGLRWEWGGREQTAFGPYRTSEEGRFALRFPGGLQYYIPKVPFDCFAELGPMLSLWESTKVDLTIAFGVRFNL